MASRAHLSIGEVLSLVQEDFPDVTISKIRFLESQGLLDPERTPSGYRKFYRADIDRLQWILTQQRDNFLPLKVIRERLDEWDATGQRPDGTGEAGHGDEVRDHDVHEHDVEELDGGPDPVPALVRERAPVPEDDPRHAAASLAAASAMEVIDPPMPDPPPSAPAAAPSASTDQKTVDEELRVGPTSSSITADELAAQCGVPASVVADLEGFGMIESRRIGAEAYYEPAAKVVVEACKRFLDHGVEVRHLRMYKIAAEREAGVFEQLVMPLLKQRNPDARARAVVMVRELSDAGESLHAALLHRALGETLP